MYSPRFSRSPPVTLKRHGALQTPQHSRCLGSRLESPQQDTGVQVTLGCLLGVGPPASASP